MIKIIEYNILCLFLGYIVINETVTNKNLYSVNIKN